MTIYFDMDGTIADFYGVENWLDYLLAEDAYPYHNAKPMLRFCSLAKVLNRLQREGYELGIISWLSKSGSVEYNERVTEVKMEWLASHLPSVMWDEIKIVPYGTPKHEVADNAGFLFDDEIGNRDAWAMSGNGISFEPAEIMEVLKML